MNQLPAARCRYQRLLELNDAVDFDDLLSLAVALLQTVPEVRQHYHELLRHVLVDEFQVGGWVA